LRPRAEISADVEHDVGVLGERASGALCVVEPSFDERDAEATEVGEVGRLAVERGDLPAALRELGDDVDAEEPRTTRDERLHARAISRTTLPRFFPSKRRKSASGNEGSPTTISSVARRRPS